MYFKILDSLFLILLILISKSSAGIIPHHEEKEHHEHHEHHEIHLPEHHHEKATSYMNFHGPVEGPAHEVKIPYIEPHHHDHKHEHHHEPEIKYVHDYVAHPKYKYSYGVEDHHTGDFHSQKEHRDGSSVTGEYSIAEPGGRLRIVTYWADKDGFHAEVHHSGKIDHSGYHHEHHPVVSTHESSQGSGSANIEQRIDAPKHYQPHIYQYPKSLNFYHAGGY